MNGLKALLDTNIVIGILKDHPSIDPILKANPLTLRDCAISQITRMELLSYPALEASEEKDIRLFLDSLTVLPVDNAIENATISFRRRHGGKLPDAIIAATAKINQLALLTLDQKLLTAFVKDD